MRGTSEGNDRAIGKGVILSLGYLPSSSTPSGFSKCEVHWRFSLEVSTLVTSRMVAER